MQKAALHIAGIFFAAGAIGHVVRVTNGIEIVIGGIELPLWVSYPGALIAILLAAWMAIAARRG